GLRQRPAAVPRREVSPGEPGEATGLRLPHDVDGISTGAAGLPGDRADAGPVAGQRSAGGPFLPVDLRHRLDLPVPRGGPAVPRAPRRPHRAGPLCAVGLADLLLRGDQAVFVRPGADVGGTPARRGPGASGVVGVTGGARSLRPIAPVGA